MEYSAFVCPLTDEGLSELGRLALNFGHAEFLLDENLGRILDVRPGMTRSQLISPLATRRKIEILEACLPGVEPEEVRQLLRDACKLIDGANGVRNDVLHGSWRINADDGGSPVAAIGKKPGKTRAPHEFVKAADDVAIATRHLMTALLIASGADPGSITLPIIMLSGRGRPTKPPSEYLARSLSEDRHQPPDQEPPPPPRSSQG